MGNQRFNYAGLVSVTERGGLWASLITVLIIAFPRQPQEKPQETRSSMIPLL